MISIKNLTKQFANNNTATLRNINLNINEGEFCILLGKNGSGKSTLLKLISKEITPSKGVIEITEKVAQVSQNNESTIAEFSVLENIALSLIKVPSFKFYSRLLDKIVAEIKELNINLEDKLDLPMKNFSGGQRQVIATLMATLSDHKILLLDEHTSALDHKMQDFLMNYTAAQIAKRKLTAIMISHKLEDALKFGNRLLLIDQGQIVLDVANEEKKALSKLELAAYFNQNIN